MTKINKFVSIIKNITNKFGLKILYLDITDVTVISRIGFSQKIFIQIYINIKKEKINLALIVAGERIYGIDKEGGFYHEHPFENSSLHIRTEQIDIENFVIKSLMFLKDLNII